MTTLGAEFEASCLTAEGLGLGADLYAQTSEISPETVDAVAAVLFALDHSSRADAFREKWLLSMRDR